MRFLISFLIVVAVGFGAFYYLNRDKTVTTPLKIVAFGDSLTAGQGVPESESYPAVLERELIDSGVLNIEVLNYGHSGDTTREALQKVKSIISIDPDIVLLGFGANDMIRKYSVEETRDNIESLLNTFKENNISVVVLGMRATFLSGADYQGKFDDLYVQLADQYDVAFVPFILDGIVLDPKFNQEDRIHPNSEGYKIMVEENIMPVLLPYIRKNFE